MSQHQINHRIDCLISILIAIGFLAAMVIVQRQDAADDKAARAHVEQRRTGGAK